MGVKGFFSDVVNFMALVKRAIGGVQYFKSLKDIATGEYDYIVLYFLYTTRGANKQKILQEVRNHCVEKKFAVGLTDNTLNKLLTDEEIKVVIRSNSPSSSQLTTEMFVITEKGLRRLLPWTNQKNIQIRGADGQPIRTIEADQNQALLENSEEKS